jgi:hypothetical protein
LWLPVVQNDALILEDRALSFQMLERELGSLLAGAEKIPQAFQSKITIPERRRAPEARAA